MQEERFPILEAWGRANEASAFLRSTYHLMRLVFSFKLALTSQVLSSVGEEGPDEDGAGGGCDPVELTDAARRILSHRVLAVPRRFWRDQYVQEQWERLDEETEMDTTGGSFDIGPTHYSHISFREVGRAQVEPPGDGGTEPNCNVAPEVGGEGRFERVSEMARRAALLPVHAGEKRGARRGGPGRAKRRRLGGAGGDDAQHPGGIKPGSGSECSSGEDDDEDDDDSDGVEDDDSDDDGEDGDDDDEVILIRPVACVHASRDDDGSGGDDDDDD